MILKTLRVRSVLLFLAFDQRHHRLSWKGSTQPFAVLTGVVGSPSPALKPGWAHADLVNESALGSLTPLPRSRSAAYQERAVQEEGHLPAIHRSHRVER